MSNNSNIEREDPIIRLHGDKVIWVIVFLLTLSSIALIYSSSSSLAFKKGVSNFSYLLGQCKFIIFGFVALITCYKIPLGVYRKCTYIAFGASILLLILTMFFGKEINGAKRWLEIGSISFQPAELMKITLILYLARVLEVFKLDTFKEFFTRIVAPVGFALVLIMYGSVSTTIVVGGLCFIILFIAGIKWSYLLKAMGIGFALLVVIIGLNSAINAIYGEPVFKRFSTAVSRIENFVIKKEIDKQKSAEEFQKEKDKSLQADMAKIAISSGGIIGKGPGNSTQRYVLPHPYSDFIYAIIVEEYGLFGGGLILMFYLWLLYRCVMLVKSCSRIFTAITVGGIGLMITIQAGLHILVNVGILPVTGHTLPLISLGGTSFIIFSAAFGIILSVSRTIDIDAAKHQEQEQIRKEQMQRELLEREKAEREAAIAAKEEQERLRAEEEELERKRELRKRGYGKSEEIVLHEIIDEKTGEFL